MNQNWPSVDFLQHPYGYVQDRIVEGAITLFGMFQGTTRKGSLEVNGRLMVDEGKLVV